MGEETLFQKGPSPTKHCNLKKPSPTKKYSTHPAQMFKARGHVRATGFEHLCRVRDLVFCTQRIVFRQHGTEEFGVVAQFFFNTQQLVVFGHAL